MVCAGKRLQKLKPKFIPRRQFTPRLSVFVPGPGAVVQRVVHMPKFLLRVPLVERRDTLKLLQPVLDVFERFTLEDGRSSRLVKRYLRGNWLRHYLRLKNLGSRRVAGKEAVLRRQAELAAANPMNRGVNKAWPYRAARMGTGHQVVVPSTSTSVAYSDCVLRVVGILLRHKRTATAKGLN